MIHINGFSAIFLASYYHWQCTGLFRNPSFVGRLPEDVLRSLTSWVLHIQPSLPRTEPRMFLTLLAATAAAVPRHIIWVCILQLCHPKRNALCQIKVHRLVRKLCPDLSYPHFIICQLILRQPEDNKRGTNWSVAKAFRRGIIFVYT